MILYYMLTIRKHQVKHFVTKDELDQCIVFAKIVYNDEDLHIEDLRYEICPKYKQLHVHVLCSSNNIIRYGRCTQYGDFRLYWRQVPVSSMQQVTRYINKSPIHNEETLIQNWSNNFNLFTMKQTPYRKSR